MQWTASYSEQISCYTNNVFNRDGMYVANIFQKSGNDPLAETAIDHFLRHPFNGRVQPEADNPGQVLWAMGEHWKFTHEKTWLDRVYPSAMKIASMIRYYRTSPGPHWVWDTSLDFGDALLKDQNVDVVHINSPIPDHAWMSIAALKAGKHVACTVPMATNIADCKKIVELVKMLEEKWGVSAAAPVAMAMAGGAAAGAAQHRQHGRRVHHGQTCGGGIHR